ncbi:Putative nuclease HARBI1 [Linum perenne]
MKRSIFWSLCELLRVKGGLVQSNNMSVDEMLAIFLVTVGHNTKNRTVQALFHRSAETISRTIRKVLLAILKLHDMLIEKPGCIGALDGTIIKVFTTKDAQPRYRTRKGDTGINVLAACNQNMQFMYCLAGWEGSAHDSRVLRDAISRTNGLRVPTVAGKYYLCDAGYANARGFLTPFRGQRYHLQEWGRNIPRTAEEYYNMKHSGARNVIERAFGILKMRWAILRDSSWFSPRMVGMIMNACCLLHNYIRREGGADIFELAYVPPSNNDSGYAAEDIEFVRSVEPTEEWNAFRAGLAQQMWAHRANR